MSRPNVRHRVTEVHFTPELPRCDADNPCCHNDKPARQRKLVYLEVATGKHFCHCHLPCGPSPLIEFEFRKGGQHA